MRDTDVSAPPVAVFRTWLTMHLNLALQVVFIGVELDRDYYESLIDELVDHALAPRMVESREEKSSEEEES